MKKLIDEKIKKEGTLRPDNNKDLKRFGLRFLILLVATSAIYVGLYTLPFFRDIVGKGMFTAVASTSLVSLTVASAISIVKKVYRNSLSNKKLMKKLSQKYDKALDLAHLISLKNNKLDFRRLKLSSAADTADQYFKLTIKRIAKERKIEKRAQRKLDRHITSTKLSDRLDKYTEKKETLKKALRINALKDKDIAELTGGTSKSMSSTNEAIKNKQLAPNYQKKLKETLLLGKGKNEESLSKMSEAYMYSPEPIDDHGGYNPNTNTIDSNDI